jgi:PAS domain S-box-containing protein
MPVSKSNRPAGTNLANHWLTRYVSALLAVAAAFLLRAGLARLAGGTAPPIYITFYPAVMLIALLCGLGPGLVATLAVALGVDYLILQPTNSLAVSSTADAIGLAFFTGTCVFLCVVAELYRRARQQAAEREAEEYLRDHLEPPTHWSRQGVLLNFGFVVSLGILAVAGWESARNVRAEDEATHSVTHSRLVIQDLDRLLSSLKDAETGQRGYLLTGEENYLEPYQAALGQIQSHLNDLRQLIQDTNRQQGVARIEAGIRDKEAELQQTIEVRRAQGLPAAVAVVTSGRGKATMDQIRAEAADLQNGEEGELQNRIATRNADTGNIFKALVAGSLLSFLLLTTIFLFLKRENTRRTEAEADARYHRDHLKDIVAARTAELAQSNEKLKLEIDGHLQSKEALRQQREYLRVTLTSIGDAVLVTDIAGIVTFVNPVAESLTGWPEDEVLGRPARSVFRIINEKTREPGEDIIARVLREKQTIALANHTALLARDGREIPIEDSAAPIRDAAGAVSGVVLVFHDATAKRRAQEALRESEERFRALTMASSDVVYRMSPDWREMRHLLGQGFIADTEKPSRNWLQEYIHPDDQAHLIATINEAIRTKSIFELEHRVLRVDGTLGWTLSRAIPRLDANGEIFEWFGTASDVTDLKQAELARAQLAAIVESSDDGIFSKNLDGIITSWNAGAERLLGYRPGEAIGRPVTMLLAPDRQDEESTIMARLQAGQRVEHFETIRLTKDGRRLDVSVTISPLRDAEGRVVGASKIIRDITGRKRAERQLRLLSTACRIRRQWHRRHRPLRQNPLDQPGFHTDDRLQFRRSGGHKPPHPQVRPPPSRILQPNVEHHPQWRTLARRAGQPPQGRLALQRGNDHHAGAGGRRGHHAFRGHQAGHHRPQTRRAPHRVARRNRQPPPQQRRAAADRRGLCAKVLEFLDCQVFFNFLADDKQKRLHLNACAGIPKAEAAKIEWLDYGVAVCGCAARDACRIVAGNIQETPDPRTDMVKSFGVQAYACHPLIVADRLLGTLSFGTRNAKGLYRRGVVLHESGVRPGGDGHGAQANADRPPAHRRGSQTLQSRPGTVRLHRLARPPGTPPRRRRLRQTHPAPVPRKHGRPRPSNTSTARPKAPTAWSGSSPICSPSRASAPMAGPSRPPAWMPSSTTALRNLSVPASRSAQVKITRDPCPP